MKLSVFPRTNEKKSDARKVRREGKIPAIFYGRNQEIRNLSVKRDEFETVLRKIKPTLLPTTLFELSEEGKTYKVLIKEVQYHPATYAIQHIDFVFISDREPVKVSVPIQILGTAECVGIKLGGFARQVIRSLLVVCLPKDIPAEFTIDIRELNIAQAKRLSDIAIPAGVRALAKMDEVAVVIAKKV